MTRGCHRTAILCAHSLAHACWQSRHCSNLTEHAYTLLHSIWFSYRHLHAHTNACEQSQHQALFAPLKGKNKCNPLACPQESIRSSFAPASQTPLASFNYLQLPWAPHFCRVSRHRGAGGGPLFPGGGEGGTGGRESGVREYIKMRIFSCTRARKRESICK